ncbi:MAG: flotillin family protein [Planctomycetales bacterium]|nr:flotillin family protein [Planctomycetales bacterium]
MPGLSFVVFGFVGIMAMGLLVVAIRCYRKVVQGTALVRNGLGGSRVSFTGMVVFPIIHQLELMEISVKRVEIYRHGHEGLVCKDNIRADIKVAFFVRVNPTADDVLHVARFVGCERSADEQKLVELFDAKFSEALKTVGKQFDFVDLYTSREQFKEQIIKTIGRDLNGYLLDDAAIDYLEQTPKEQHNPDNILDAEGIKKITDLTAKQAVLANDIERDKEKTIRKQDVEAREAILELDRQQAEAEERQAKEIAAITARERAEAKKVQEEERLKAESARIATEEQLQVAEENKLRQIIVAQKSKERTDKVETERVEKDRELENVERRRIVSIADIEKDKAIEVEKKEIQDVIRERVMVERKVVEEQQKILDTEQFAGADRSKRVAVTKAEEEAEQALVKEVKAAEAQKTAAERHAEQLVIEADAKRDAAERETHAKKMLAEATAAETAAAGLGEARVIEAKAEANFKQGETEANVSRLKYESEAKGITDKAEAMKLFHDAGKEHEEFKLKLNKDLEVELKAIDIQKEIAKEQAEVIGQALKSARIDIVGGDSEFFDRIVNSVTGGKVVDRYVGNSSVLSDVKQTFFNGDPAYFQKQLSDLLGRFSLGSDDVKNLSIAALIGKMLTMADSDQSRSELQLLLEMAQNSGLADKKLSALNLGLPTKK